MILTFEDNLDRAKMNERAKYLGQRSYSSKGCCPDRHAELQIADLHTPGRFLYLDH